ncbi:MAG: hypothetical protein ACLSCX_09490 [Oscillospiraceae bacterium]
MAHERQISSAALPKTAALRLRPLQPRCRFAASDHNAPDAAVRIFAHRIQRRLLTESTACAGFHKTSPSSVPRNMAGGNMVSPAPKTNEPAASVRKKRLPRTSAKRGFV